jgi:hypothetical protein
MTWQIAPGYSTLSFRTTAANQPKQSSHVNTMLLLTDPFTFMVPSALVIPVTVMVAALVVPVKSSTTAVMMLVPPFSGTFRASKFVPFTKATMLLTVICFKVPAVKLPETFTREALNEALSTGLAKSEP